MQEQARFAVVNRYNEDQIRDNIFKMVQDLEIPVKREQIKSALHELRRQNLRGVHRARGLAVLTWTSTLLPSSENKSVL